MQINHDQLRAIDEKLRALGYAMRSGTGSNIYFITLKQITIFGTETYCLVFEDDGWRINTISANASLEKRDQIEATVKAVLEAKDS